jgi:hypothetical protein
MSIAIEYRVAVGRRLMPFRRRKTIAAVIATRLLPLNGVIAAR